MSEKQQQMKSAVEGEAMQLSLQLYNLNLDKTRIEKRLQELSVINATVTEAFKEAPKSDGDGDTKD